MRHGYRVWARLLPALLAMVGVAQAALNSPARLTQLAQLPDWTGVWLVEGTTATLDPSGRAPPYNAAWQARYQDMRKYLNRLIDTNVRICTAGVPRLMGSPYQFSILVTPGETLMHFNQREVRHIYTDGRAHPTADELWPLYWGDSVGHWEEQTLVIDTISLKGGLWIDPTGATLSDKMHVTERIDMSDHNHLRARITIQDPDALRRPWQFTRTYRRAATKDLIETDCHWKAGMPAKANRS